MVLATIISQAPLEDTVRSLDKQSVIIVAIIISISDERYLVIYVAAPVHEQTSVFIRVGGRLQVHSVLQMNFMNFICTFIQSLMRIVGGLQHVNTFLLCLIRVFDAVTKCNYRCVCHSGLCCRQADTSCPVPYPAEYQRALVP